MKSFTVLFHSLEARELETIRDWQIIDHSKVKK